LVEADAQDQVFFGRADGAEAAEEILEEDQELAGIFVVDQVAVGTSGRGTPLRADAALPSAVFGPLDFLRFGGWR
jgi:hypothetical protein